MICSSVFSIIFRSTEDYLIYYCWLLSLSQTISQVAITLYAAVYHSLRFSIHAVNLIMIQGLKYKLFFFGLPIADITAMMISPFILDFTQYFANLYGKLLVKETGHRVVESFLYIVELVCEFDIVSMLSVFSWPLTHKHCPWSSPYSFWYQAIYSYKKVLAIWC